MNNLKLVQSKQSDLEQNNLKMEIVKSISLGECTIPEDIVNKFDIPYEQVITLFSDPNFTNLIANYTKAKLSMNFHTKAVPRLMNIVDSNDNKESITAIKLLAQLTQNLKGVQSTDVNINLNLESLVKETEKQVNFINVESRKVS